MSGNGRWFSVRDPSIGLTCAEAFAAAESAFGTLGATGGYHTDKSLGGNYRGGTIGASPAYSFTAHAVEVDVDVETGWIDVKKIWAAHDCGFALNPTLVEGQIAGSVYMGWAEAVMEEQASRMAVSIQDSFGGPVCLIIVFPPALRRPKLNVSSFKVLIPMVRMERRRRVRDLTSGPAGHRECCLRCSRNSLDRLPFHPAVVRAALKAKEEGETC